MQSVKWEVAASCPKGCSKSTPSREFMCLCSLLHMENEHKRRNERRRRTRVRSSEGSLGRAILLSRFSRGLLQCSFTLSPLPVQNRRAGPVGGRRAGRTQASLSLQGCSSELTAQWSVQHRAFSASPKASASKCSP